MVKSVVIVAGGSGTRMGHQIPKQFLSIANKPILVHTIEAFIGYDAAIDIVLVLPQNHIQTWLNIQSTYLPDTSIRVAIGGDTRFDSVSAGLALVESGLVAIHDAVRPLISRKIIANSFIEAQETGSGVVMIPLKDSLRKETKDGTRALDRKDYFLVQTPQTFQVNLLKSAFESVTSNNFTDDATVFESAGHPITRVEGDYYNIKLTTPEDLLIAEAFMKEL